MWQRIKVDALPRHSHRLPYAAIVLSGGYEEAGDSGWFRLDAGSVLFHSAFEAHLDRFWGARTEILNIPLEPSAASFVGRIADPDLLVRTAERSIREAAVLLIGSIRPERQGFLDWPEQLAADILANPSLNLSDWTRAHALRPWKVSREFQQVFGISPSAFRARARGRHAWFAVTRTSRALADIAAGLNFADQAHMTRAVKAITERPPGAWRSCK